MDKRKIYKLADNLIDLFKVVIELQQALDEIIEDDQEEDAHLKSGKISTGRLYTPKSI